MNLIDPSAPTRAVDVAIVGAGAAGLATAIFLRRREPSCVVRLFEGARKPGAKILVSGGSRCNVTNASVTERDFWGSARPLVRRVLRRLSVDQTVAFFAEIGVRLHEEADGKLFPDSNRSRDVLDALLREAAGRGAYLDAGHRIRDVRKEYGAFVLVSDQGTCSARAVVLATGGQSLPKTGSDGTGFAIAASLGHAIVPTTPGLVPLEFDDEGRAIGRRLTGVAHLAELRLWVDECLSARLAGSLLWTHFGISGPVTLNMSRHYLRSRLDGHSCRLTLRFTPDVEFEALDARWTALCGERPRASILTVLASFVPESVASVLLEGLAIASHIELARLTRDDRRRLVHALTDWPLPVAGSRGYNYAEVTAGGVPLEEIDTATMQSRVCPGLFLVGEMLDVDGRIGGFNFQWAWASGFVAAHGVADRRIP